jgi:hypothetical protein
MIRLLRLVLENFWWKLLSLAAAVVIWAMVASEPELATFATVRLEYKNLPEDLEISSEPISSVVLEVRGPSGELRGVGEGVRPTVVLDMGDVGPGQRTFMVGDGNVKLARGVHLVRSIPSQVTFNFEIRRVAQVPVQVRWLGDPSGLPKSSVDPAAEEIVGPASRVARIRAAITDPVDVAGLRSRDEVRVNVALDPPDPFVRLQSSPQVTVSIAGVGK